MSETRPEPVNTYRVQLHRGFGFSSALEIAPYLSELGVTDLYTSPYLRANPGSTHGYDICDHGELNPELGTSVEYDAFTNGLKGLGLGHVLDIVPNHMACDARSNPWWRDVLENGPSSPYSRYFDIDWKPTKPELVDRVLLPVLGDQYGTALERGELQLVFTHGALHLMYFDLDLPVNPRQAPRVFDPNLDRLQQELQDRPDLREFLSVLTALRNLPPYTDSEPARVKERQREKEIARERFARLVATSREISVYVEDCVRSFNGVVGERGSFDNLHDLLERQAYRLAYWRTAFDEINYRRFFDVNGLVGLRMEEPQVFDAAHRLLKELVAAGHVTGLRVDHPDGLFDPDEYFDRLRRMTDDARRNGDRAARTPLYVVAEKILSADEALPTHWAVSGTTGYGFMNQVAGLLLDGRQAPALRRIYARLTGRQEPFEEVAYDSKRTIMLTALAGELNVLTHALNRISEGDRRVRDFTLNSCRKVLREVIACFPVYRTYVSRRGVSEYDRAVIETAVSEAQRRNPLMEASIFDFVRRIVLSGAEGSSDEHRLFAMKLQQFTAPVQAKGVEDTAFYRYNVLIAANDVGGHPGRLGVSPEEFHGLNAQRLGQWPLEMVTTATHDMKRGEDTRMRLNVLSELPDQWKAAAASWMRTNNAHRSKVSGAWAPDRNDEYHYYQAILGAWPCEDAEDPVPDAAPDDFVRRVDAYMQKAVREAKVHTSWIDENPAYGRAVGRFVDRTLKGPTAPAFLREFVPFQRRVARVGVVNSLSQLVLKLASPGVCDTYQGNELWDLTLVDPDNRRPVDFPLRREWLAALMPLIAASEGGASIADDCAGMLTHWKDGRIKLHVTACGLRFRQRHADVVLSGAYVPLAADGPGAAHLVAFGRHHRSGTLVAIAPRLPAPLMDAPDQWPIGESAWQNTRILLPPSLAARRYRHLLTGETVDVSSPADPALRAAAALATSPVALLWSAA